MEIQNFNVSSCSRTGTILDGEREAKWLRTEWHLSCTFHFFINAIFIADSPTPIPPQCIWNCHIFKGFVATFFYDFALHFAEKAWTQALLPVSAEWSEIVTFLKDLWLLSFTILPCILQTKHEHRPYLQCQQNVSWSRCAFEWCPFICFEEDERVGVLAGGQKITRVFTKQKHLKAIKSSALKLKKWEKPEQRGTTLQTIC